jgi:hypothetical protein
MSEDNGGSWLLRNAGTLIAVTALAGSIIAQWAVIDDRIKTIDQLESSLAALTSRMDRLEVRYEYLRDIVTELRDKSDTKTGAEDPTIDPAIDL